MWNDEPAPIDSYDCYAMGLRPPRCNGCEYESLKWKLSDKFLSLSDKGWVSVYELDTEPLKGQGEPTEYNGVPIRFRASFMSIGHSDECWHFKTPDYPYKPEIRHIPGLTWRTKDGQVIPINELADSHLINILRYLDREGKFNKRSSTVKALIKEASKRKVKLTTGNKVNLLLVAIPDYKGAIARFVAKAVRFIGGNHVA